MAETFTEKDAASFLKDYSPPEKQSPRVANDRPLLQGRVEFSPEMEARAAKEMPTEPAPVESFMLPIREANRGVASVPEDLADFALGAGQTVANVPQNRRVTSADLIRKLDPGFVGPNELPRSQAYQQAVQRHNVMRNVLPAANLVGSFGFPLGEIQQAITKAPLAVKVADQTGQMLAKLGAMGKEVPIAQNAAQTLRLLQQGARPSLMQKARMLAGPAASGAAYANVFQGGRQFGEERTLPNAQQVGANTLGGGVLGAGMGTVAALLNQLKLKSLVANLAQMSPMKEQPSIGAQQLAATKNVLPEAPVVGQGFQNMTVRNLSRDANPHTGAPRSPQQKQAVQDRMYRMAMNKFGDESTEHQTAILKGQASFERARLKEAEGQRRQTQQTANRQDNRQYSEQRQAQNIDRTRAQTGVSEVHYTRLANAIAQSNDMGEMQDIWTAIHAPGAGPTGKGQLEAHQRADLKAMWRRRYRQLFEDEGGGPGESAPSSGGPQLPGNQPEGPAGTTPSAPPHQPQPGPAAPTKSPKSPNEQPPEPRTPNKPTPSSPLRTFIEGAFRKTFDKRLFGSRENRYKLAVSWDALADAAGLPQHERTAMQKWIGELADTRRELTYKELQIKQLVEWADKHEDDWIGTQTNVKHSRKSDAQGNMHHILEHTQREEKFKRIVMRVKMEQHFEEHTQQNLEFAETREPDGTQRLVTESAPTVEVTTNGIAHDWQQNQDGSLALKGNIHSMQLPEFKPPSSADELFKRLEDLMEWRDHFRKELKQIKTAAVLRREDTRKIIHSYDHLGDGTTPTNVMEKAFDTLKMPWINGRAPDTHVWHVDQTGHVTTVRFKQARTTAKAQAVQQVVDDKLAKVDKLLDQVRDKDGKIDYDALWANKKLLSQLHAYLPGMEIGLLPVLFGRQINKAGRAITSKVSIVTAGTIDNILRDHPQFGGQDLSDSLHKMMGEIAGNYLTDKHGEWHPIKSPEELAELLNDFKGTKVQRSAYRKRAVELSEEQIAKKGGELTEQEYNDAIRRADTAFMIREKYKKLAAGVETKLDELKIRKRDAETGVPSAEGRRYYQDADLDEQGRVRLSAYSALFHDGLQQLHDGLTLNSNSWDLATGIANSFGSRVSQSIMANKPSTALKNFFDQAPFTFAYYHKHFVRAVIDVHSKPEFAEAISRMPVIPQADMSLVQLEGRLADERKPENFGEAASRAYDRLNHFLQVQLDPIFKGHAPLVSLADRIFAKYSALASFYKSAELRGYDRHEFVSDLINDRLPASTKEAVLKEMSDGLTQTLNTMQPHLNRDLYASSVPGKFTAAYATPGRRAFKLWVGWMKSDKPSDKLKLISSFMGMVAFGGRGAVPASLLGLYTLGAAMVGQKEQAEENLKKLDQLNVLRKIGIDWSQNFGPDIITNSQPAIESMQKLPGRIAKAAVESHNPVETVWNTTAATALDGFHMFPRVGPLGYSTWTSLLKDVGAAHDGMKEQYFEYNGQLQKVPVLGYTYADALRDWLIGGITPKAVPLIEEKKQALAQRDDAKYRANKQVQAEASSPLKDLLTGRKVQ